MSSLSFWEVSVAFRLNVGSHENFTTAVTCLGCGCFRGHAQSFVLAHIFSEREVNDMREKQFSVNRDPGCTLKWIQIAQHRRNGDLFVNVLKSNVRGRNE